MSLTDTDVTITGVQLNAPGDTVTYTFDVKNDGKIPAKLSKITDKEATITPVGSDDGNTDKTLVEQNYEFSLVYGEGDDKAGQKPGTDDTLAVGQTRHLKLTITYKDADSLPSQKVTVSGSGATLLYVQDTSA